ncbi:MAG: hypothetical protein AB7I13_10130 [Vicinamibacterales bacterium]
MKKTLMTMTSTLALVGLIALPTPARAADADRRQITLEREATGLVDRVEEVGREVQFHVDRLKTLAGHPEISAWSHYQHLDRIKHLVNTGLRPALTRLADVQRQLPDWKQESVTRMIAAAQQLSTDATSAFFKKQDSLRMPVVMNAAYTQFLAEMSVHADSLVSTADFAHEYASLRLKAAEAGLRTN